MDRDEKNKPDNDWSKEDPSGEHRSFIRTLFKRGEEFIEELLEENEKHRLRIMQLENEIRNIRQSVPPSATLDELRDHFDKLKKEHDELRKLYKEVVGETDKYKERYRVIEEENDKLVNLFVASYQLHSTLDFPQAVQVLLEILLNFVGAGRFALFLLDELDGRLHPVSAYGLDLSELGTIGTDHPAMGESLKLGRPSVYEDVPAEGEWGAERPVVCIPLRFHGDITGALVVYGFLQQKTEVVAIDMELFKLLSDHAASVLESARLYSTSGQHKRTVADYEALLPKETSP